MSLVHHPTTITERWDVGQVAAAIDVLTEDAFIEISDFYLYHTGNAWHRRDSSSYLVLLLLCTPRTSVRQSLHIWPPFPIIRIGKDHSPSGFDNITAALEHKVRVYEVMLHDLSFVEFVVLVGTMQQPFPELAYLELRTDEYVVPTLPDSFSGRSAPYLEGLNLLNIPFQALPKLLLSAPDLESLLYIPHFQIPYSEHISPNTMLTCLSALSSLEETLDLIPVPVDNTMSAEAIADFPRRSQAVFVHWI